MQTHFSPEQLKNSSIERSNQILRACVHCGFCTATCPTYQILGDELDSPRGRIYLIKDMLENNRIPDDKTVTHIDRCLSCLACMSTCPSGVHYMHLIDYAREYVEEKYSRRWDDKAIRWLLATVLPYPERFRLSIYGAWLAKPFSFLLPKKLKAMVDFAPEKLPPVSKNDRAQTFKARGKTIKRVALMTGCAQKVLNTEINDATIRILTRHGCDVVVAKGSGCCGALTHHMGKGEQSRNTAAKNINAWINEMDNDGLDAIVINASGCGTTVKDYGHMFKNHPLENEAKRVGAITKDISEVLGELDLVNSSDDKKRTLGLRVAYHSACSLQHGQQIKTLPKTLLEQVGFEVVEPKEAHLCCGSAGTYNLMQPTLSEQLKKRKTDHLLATNPDVIVTGNIGCMMQIGSGTSVTGTSVPTLHTIQMLDFATGGPMPNEIKNIRHKISKGRTLMRV
ncbi:Glycolate dehydrogenase, iron-sulfur subunit GlcF [hydrothermal vent metagenome]|uniref:Glycolate dehydrogenase, iron-sulfur subunit GlcF n=1 Tax=hydrothermal vent metagenome TaxID=652676 RepID=A0A3B0TDM3_9ZZZZ